MSGYIYRTYSAHDVPAWYNRGTQKCPRGARTPEGLAPGERVTEMRDKPTIPRVCAHCGAAFLALPTPVKYGLARYCSRTCARTGRMETTETRFWSKVHKTEDCWLWQAGVTRTGYGMFWVRSSDRGAHRVAWELTNGPIPEGQWVLHRCDNPPCVNPAHLFLGDHDANMADKVAKGRQATGDRAGARTKPERFPRGLAVHTHKLTEDDVRAIRSAYAAGGISQPDLARRYGITQAAVWRVIHRLSWAHVR